MDEGEPNLLAPAVQQLLERILDHDQLGGREFLTAATESLLDLLERGCEVID
jgi:hypothetical protein